jgi:hypothetical protein
MMGPTQNNLLATNLLHNVTFTLHELLQLLRNQVLQMKQKSTSNQTRPSFLSLGSGGAWNNSMGEGEGKWAWRPKLESALIKSKAEVVPTPT